MLKGDLATTPLPDVLRLLADGVASGCLHVNDGVAEEAKVYLRGGQVYAVQVPGRRPQLGARLVSSGSLGPEGLAEALEAQRTELQGWRLGELLVHLGYVDQPVVEAFIHEQVREQTSDLMRWPTGTWKFRVNERTREDVAPPTSVEVLLSDIAARMAQWETITEVLHGPDAVPLLSAAGQSDAELAIDPEAWSLLCKVDGHRSIAELARECGFTLFEAGQVVYFLVRSGLLEVEEELAGPEPYEAPTGSVASRLAAAFAPAGSPDATADQAAAPEHPEEQSPAEMASLITAALRQDRTAEALAPVDQDVADESIDRISQSLSALLGPTTDEHLFDAPKPRVPKVKPEAKVLTAAEQERAAKKAEKAARDAKRRAHDSVELAAAQADLEATKAADAEKAAAALTPGHEAEIVSLDHARREAARRDEEAEAARLAAEAEAEQARLAAAEADAEAVRLAEEQAAAQASEAEEARLAAEAEEVRLAEEARLAAEAEEARLAAEAEEAWHAAEAEVARVAEQQAQLAAAQVEDEARQSAAQAEAEADQVEAQAAQAEAARVEQEQADQVEAEAARVEHESALERAKVEAELRLAAEKQAAAAAEAEAEAAVARRLAEQASADDGHDEQVRRTKQRADASEAFAELSATAASASDVQVLEAEQADATEDAAGEVEDDWPAYQAPDTDMASLFRELSSLGMEDAPEPPPVRPVSTPPRATPTVPVKAPAKKKKGLFGR